MIAPLKMKSEYEEGRRRKDKGAPPGSIAIGWLVFPSVRFLHSIIIFLFIFVAVLFFLEMCLMSALRVVPPPII